MANKTISINLSQDQNMNINSFKQAMGIFPIKRIHYGKFQAIVQFLRNKDLEAFQFTNANGKIANLGGALYQKVDQKFRWSFPKDQVYTLNQLQDNNEDRDETETGSQENSSPKQEEVGQTQNKMDNLQLERDELKKVGLRHVNSLRQALRNQRIKQEQYRNSRKQRRQQPQEDENSEQIQEKYSFKKLKSEILDLIKEPSLQKFKQSESLISLTIVLVAFLMGMLIIFN